jgi:hypothetical protein
MRNLQQIQLTIEAEKPIDEETLIALGIEIKLATISFFRSKKIKIRFNGYLNIIEGEGDFIESSRDTDLKPP